jgi:hypothetical protein
LRVYLVPLNETKIPDQPDRPNRPDKPDALRLAGCGKARFIHTRSWNLLDGVDVKIVAGCSKRPSSKAAASEEARRTLRYVEPLSDARTMLAGFFSILLKVSRLDHILDTVDVKPVTGGIEHPDRILPFQQFLEQLRNAGLAVGWFGQHFYNDVGDEGYRAG